MSDCTHNCKTCGSSCGERKEPQSFLAPPNAQSHIKKVIGVVSGKGGVGKSLVTSLLAVAMQKKGFSTAILDADVTGPSIPKAFGLHDRAVGTADAIQPVLSRGGTKVMSINLLLQNPEDPVVWRGPVIAGTVKQFWSDVVWGEVDYMFVDMPPGTGDVPLTVFQSLPLDGIVIVTSPQELVSMIVEKALKMAEIMHIPVLGLVENMSYFACPACGEKHSIFGESHIDGIAAKYGLSVIARLPIDPAIAGACDAGNVESVDAPWLEELARAVK